MKKLSPYERGNKFWSEMLKKLNEYMSHGIPTNPSVRMTAPSSNSLTEEDFVCIQSIAKFEVLCFAAYCAYVAGSKLFIKLIRGFDRQSWVEFCKGISDGMHAQIIALPQLKLDSFLPPAEEADMVLIRYMQIFTNGDARANIPWILTMDKSTLGKSFLEFSDSLKASVCMLSPNSQYPSMLMCWCPNAEYIYNCAVKCAENK
jgi:hypothetical protein